MHGADDRKPAAPPAGPGRRQADRSHLYRRPGERHHLRAEIHHPTARTLHHGGAELSACHLLKVSLTRETAMHQEKPERHWLWVPGETLGRLAVDCDDDVTRVFHLALTH